MPAAGRIPVRTLAPHDPNRSSHERLNPGTFASTVSGCVPSARPGDTYRRTIRMATQSKWQSLPTEAINPVSLAIDKTAVRDIIEMVVNEDRKVIAAVHKEKER